MAAGLGFIEFTTGDVLSAAAANGYLASQTVMVFASAAARTSAIASPQEGMFSFLKDTNATQFYDGAAWTNLDTTGMVNPMTTTGDTIYSSSGTTPARLGIGSTGQVLTVAAGIPSWATPSGGGGMTLINSGGTALTGGSVTIGSIPGTYKSLRLVIVNYNSANANAGIRFRINGDANTRYSFITVTGGAAATFGQTSGNFATDNSIASAQGLTVAEFPDYANATTWKFASVYSALNNFTTSTSVQLNMGMSVWNQTGAITSLDLLAFTGNLSGGTAYLYGVN
jgi:hypothetical protein